MTADELLPAAAAAAAPVPPVATPGPAKPGSDPPPGSEFDDVSAAVAQIQAAEELKSRLEADLQACLDTESTKLHAAATADWAKLSPLRALAKTSEAGAKTAKAKVARYVEIYSAKQVQCSNDLGEQSRVLTPPEVAEAETWLRSSPGPQAAGGTNSIGMKFVSIAAGSFQMGSPSSEKGHQSDETQHRVKLSKSFLMATTEVTQKQWRSVMGSNPSEKDYKGVSLIGNTLPVQNVSWEDAVKFANALSKKEGLRAAYRISGKSVSWNKSANGYRLPTEAEWEYAARAGKHRLYAGTDSLSSVCRYASVNTAQSKSKFGWDWDAFPCEDGHLGAAPVGSFKPNAWGLYDMTGNVNVWCWDWYDKKYGGSSTDPVGAQSGDVRVLRGGSWSYYFPALARVAIRSGGTPDYRDDDLGLRLVRTNP
jgi:formylglycine-generating enzyme required for sulfatase activity